MFYLKTLGELSLHASGPTGPPLLRNAKPLAVLAYLATLPDRSARREHVAELLWPEADASHGRSSLRQALFHISQRVGRPVIQADESNLALDRTQLEVDIWEFERALEAGDYERAVELYGGPFAPGLERKVGAELEGWIESKDEQLRAGLEVAYSKLIGACLEAGAGKRAVRFARRYVELNPLNEDAQLTLIRALKVAGDQVGALQAYRSYRSLLREALDGEPSAELERAIASVREAVLSDPRPDSDATVAARPRRSTWRWIALSGLAGAAGTAVVLAIGLYVLRPSDTPDAAFDGLRGTFHVLVGAEYPLHVARVDYRRDEVRVEVTEHSAGAVFSPDGSLVATSFAAANGMNLGVLNVESGELRELTTQPQDEVPVDWSPDGRSILFRQGVLLADGRDYSWVLMAYDLATGREHRVGVLEARTPSAAAWSPRGVDIAVEADSEGTRDVFLMDADGTDPVALTGDPADDFGPAWSPDGTRLAFASERSGASDIYVIDRDGSGLRRVTRTPVFELGPVWLSHRVLAFVRRAAGETGDLWAVDLEGGGGQERRLTHRGDIRDLARGSGDTHGRSWIDRLNVTAEEAAASPGQYVPLDLELVDAAGRKLNEDEVRITWSTGDPAVAELAEPGMVRVLDSGDVVVTASAGGWRADTLELPSLYPVRGATTLLLYEDWSGGVRPERWIRWGRPMPYARVTGGPEGGGLLVPNGDSIYASGVVSRQAFAPGGGLTVEVWGRMPFDGRLYQDFAVGFSHGKRPEEEGAEWETLRPIVELWVHGPNEQDGAGAWIGLQGRRIMIPFPPDPEEWHLYGLQLERDGSVGVLIDGRFYWRTGPEIDMAALPALNVVLGYRSLGIEVAHGLLRLYYGTKFLLPEVGSDGPVAFDD